MGLKEELKTTIGCDFGFEVVGDIAIIEPLCEEKFREKGIDCSKIGEIIRRYAPNVNVIALKVGDVSGTYRVGEHKIIKEYDRTKVLELLPKQYRDLSSEETLHVEHGIRCLLNINKTYFSTKLGFERKRIAEMVNDNEKILLLFAGTGIFGLVIAKTKNVVIDAVEINPYACEYMEKNIQINKLKGTIRVFCMDAKEFLSTRDVLEYDRIIMPAPKDAPSFIQEVIKKAKKEAYIHHYFFHDRNINQTTIEEMFKNYSVKILSWRKAGSIGTNKYRIVVDLVKE